MQIELENEFNVLSDYAELTLAFKIPPGVGRSGSKATAQGGHGSGPAPVHPRSAVPLGGDPTRSPRWEIRTPESKRQADQHPSQQETHQHQSAVLAFLWTTVALWQS